MAASASGCFGCSCWLWLWLLAVWLFCPGCLCCASGSAALPLLYIALAAALALALAGFLAFPALCRSASILLLSVLINTASAGHLREGQGNATNGNAGKLHRSKTRSDDGSDFGVGACGSGSGL